MVDFRYHLVSLVSVFLALAIGIILGAGPLQNSIGNALTGQVETLRESRDELRAELDAATAEIEGNDQAFRIAAQQLLPGSLDGRTVSIVLLPGVESDAEIEEMLTLAGATIGGKVQLTDAFSISSQKTYRSALAGQMRNYVTDLADDASEEAVIAGALDTVLRTGGEGSDTKVLLGSLTAEENAMVTIVDPIVAPADAVVVIAPGTLYDAESTDADATAEANARTELYASAFSTMAGRGATVAVGQAIDGTDILSVMRGREAGSTVDTVGTMTAAFNVAIAVGNEITGDHVSLGVQEGATAALGTRSDAAYVPPEEPQADGQQPGEEQPADPSAEG